LTQRHRSAPKKEPLLHKIVIASVEEEQFSGAIMARKYSKGASKSVERAMKKRKKGTLKSGRSGRKVKSKKQAVAIGLSEARKKGAKVPRKKRL
jgi:hypothetical protein